MRDEGFRQLGSPGVQRAARLAQHQGLEHHKGTAEGWQHAWQLRGASEQWGWEPTAEGAAFPAPFWGCAALLEGALPLLALSLVSLPPALVCFCSVGCLWAQLPSEAVGAGGAASSLGIFAQQSDGLRAAPAGDAVRGCRWLLDVCDADQLPRPVGK